MQTVDVTALKNLGPAKNGPWLLGDNGILRTSAHGAPFQTYAQAQGVFDAYRTASDAGAGTPRPLEIVKVGDGFGVVVEYVTGIGLSTHIAYGFYTPQEAGEILGTLMRRLHGLRCASARDVREAFVRYARRLARLLAPPIAERLVTLVDAIPREPTLLHGDMHVGNVVVCAGEPRLIDLEVCGFGHPVFDLAIARARLPLDQSAPKLPIPRVDGTAARDAWRACLQAYFQDAESDCLEEMERKLTVLSEVDQCSIEYGIAKTADQDLTDRQRARLAICEGRLGDLLPRIDRLDFGKRR